MTIPDHPKPAQNGSPFHGRNHWTIESPEICVSVLECGGHIAETTWKRKQINPLWIQDRPTIDPDQFDFAVHGPVYGFDSEARLISGLAGHNLCLPWWGPPSTEEFAAGMTFHGETNIVRWRALAVEKDKLVIEAMLPEAGIRVQRVLRCAGAILHFETKAENLTACDKPLAWCEHVTFGPPFLDGQWTRFFATLGRGFRTSNLQAGVFGWPEGRGVIPCDLTRFSQQPHADLVNSFLVDSSREYACFAAWNSHLGLAFGYVFRRSEFSWLNVWENNDERRLTRGMEFSNTPIEGSAKELFASPSVLDNPTFEWLSAKGSVSKSFYSFSVEIPQDFGGIADVRSAPGELILEETGTGRLITLPVT